MPSIMFVFGDTRLQQWQLFPRGGQALRAYRKDLTFYKLY